MPFLPFFAAAVVVVVVAISVTQSVNIRVVAIAVENRQSCAFYPPILGTLLFIVIPCNVLRNLFHLIYLSVPGALYRIWVFSTRDLVLLCIEIGLYIMSCRVLLVVVLRIRTVKVHSYFSLILLT